MPRTGAGGKGGGIFGWDGSNWQRLQVDASYYLKCILQAGTAVIGKLAANSGVDIGDVDVLTINAVAPQFDDSDKLAVSIYGQATNPGDQTIRFQAPTSPNLRVTLFDGNNSSVLNTSQADGVGTSLRGLLSFVYDYLFNDSGWDRQRNNYSPGLLGSSARTATTQSSLQTNFNHRGLVLCIDVTARAAATTLTPSLQMYDSTADDYVTIWTAAAAINSGDTTVAYSFYPSPSTDAANLYTEAVDIIIPRSWRLVVTHSDADSITYSAKAHMVL